MSCDSNYFLTNVGFFKSLHFTCITTVRLPTLFFIRDAKLRYRMEGALTAEELDQLVDYILFDGPAPTRDDLTPNKTKADE